MASASFLQESFRGGEWSKSAQGALSDPRYRTAMGTCLNAFPTEPGAWIRRSGTRFCATTRGAVPGRVISFDFHEQAPYTIELTAGYIRFFSGANLATTNDAATVSSISTASPAVVETAAAHGFSTGNSGFFSGLGTSNPKLQNRVLTITVTDSTHFSIADAVTGASIDGSSIGTFSAGSFNRIQEIVSPFVTDTWKSVQLVQAEQNGLLLNGSFEPQVLSAETQPSATEFASFSLSPANFVDGPYLDPPTNGVLLTPSGATGIIDLTVEFVAWSATVVYPKGTYTTYSSVTYVSLADQNLNHQPDTSGSYWQAVGAVTAIAPQGFVSTDIGRHLRLYSEPTLWAVGSTYTAGQVVSYVDINKNTAYYTCLSNHTAALTNAPLVSSTTWGVNAAGAAWTWGKITALLNVIDPNPSGSSNVGDMVGGGGLVAAFDGNTNKSYAACAYGAVSVSVGPPGNVTNNTFVGKAFSSGQSIKSATVYPSNDLGLFFASGNTAARKVVYGNVYLYGSNSNPASAFDGTLLGSAAVAPSTISLGGIGAGTSPVVIVSSDQTTAFEYVWVAAQGIGQNNDAFSFIMTVSNNIAQVQFTSATTTGTSNGVTAELLGGNLKYTNSIRTWRLGLYSGTSGWPSCGTYHEGRVWLSGSVGNRIDSSAPNQDISGQISFAPTTADGTVTSASAISYTFSAPDINDILWMQSDQQGIICGTQKREWLVQPAAQGAITATNIAARPVTKTGCANILPCRTEHTILIVQRHKRKIVEYFADVFSGKYSAPNLSEKAKHLTVGNIEEIAYQQELTPILWARRGDGVLVGMTYKRETLMTSQGPSINGWHRHELGSGRTVSSISVGQNVNGDVDGLSMVTVDSDNISHVEIIEDQFEENEAITHGWFLDNAVESSSYSNAIVMGGASGIIANGFWHLNGKSVTVFAGGLDLGEYTVSDGSVSVPFEKSNALFTSDFVAGFSGAMKIVVGFCYTSRGQLLPPDTPQDGGARNGPGFGKLRRMHKYAVSLVSTQKIKFGTSFDKTRELMLRSAGRTQVIAANELYTGTLKENVDDAGQDFSSQLCWEAARPFPAIVAGAGGFLQTSDE